MRKNYEQENTMEECYRNMEIQGGASAAPFVLVFLSTKAVVVEVI
jgi:hypothetical protein